MKEFTPEFINHLQPNEIFVFGSNENGNHYGGAARIAYDNFGAVWGKAVGRYGNSYAIPTLDREMKKIKPEKLGAYLQDFLTYVSEHKNLKFYMTKIGCGIAGWSVSEVKKILWAVMKECPENLILPKDFTNK